MKQNENNVPSKQTWLWATLAPTLPTPTFQSPEMLIDLPQVAQQMNCRVRTQISTAQCLCQLGGPLSFGGKNLGLLQSDLEPLSIQELKKSCLFADGDDGWSSPHTQQVPSPQIHQSALDG